MLITGLLHRYQVASFYIWQMKVYMASSKLDTLSDEKQISRFEKPSTSIKIELATLPAPVTYFAIADT